VNSTTKRLLRGIEILAWAAFFAFAALVLALRFWVLPDIERYREDIVAAVSRGIGLPVRVGAIEAGWLGLRPQITLTDVRIHDAEGREALTLPSIHNVVAWSSLLHGELRLHRLAIERPRLTIRRDAAGDLHVAGLKLARGQSGGGGGGVGGWLLGQDEIVVHDAEIEWRDEQRGAPPLLLSGVELRLASSGTSLAIGLSARPPAELASDFELRAEVDAAGQPSSWSGRVFLQVGYTDLAAWRAWLDYPINVRSGQGALRVWTSVEQGAVKRLTADLALANVDASLGDELSPLELASLNGRVQGRILGDGAELSGKRLALVMTRGTEIPPTDFEIVWRPQSGGSLGASALDLEAIVHLVESLPLPPQIELALKELAPRGRLADAKLEWTGPFDAPSRLSAKSRFSDLALRARGDAPGFAGLSGSIEATLDKGKLHLAARKAELELPRIFHDPRIALDTLNGDLEWERDAARGLAVRVSSLSFANAHASGNLFGNYARRDEGPGVIDLSAVLSRADGTALARYLPQPPLLKEELRNWLARAILAGESSDVRVRLRGDLRQFPFTDPASGQFQVSARIDKGVLDYADGWPRIHDIVGELNFEREKMEIIARSGAILGARLANVRVSIPNLRTPDRHLLVNGQADGPSDEFLKYLASSPLRDKVGTFVTSMKADGRGRLRLHLDLPLADLPKSKIAGEYDFTGNQVTLVPWLPPVDQAQGRFSFTDSSFTLHEARGRLLGGAVTATGGTRPARGLEINARGDATVAAARAVFDHPLNKLVSGGFAYTVAVRAQEGSGAASGARVTFDSPLRGLASALPAPLAKGAAETLPLRVEVIPAAGGQRDRITLSLGNLARAEVSRRKQDDEMVVQRTAVWLSPERDQPIRFSERPGTLIYGALGSFDADRWLALFPAASPTAAPQPGTQSPPVTLDLRFSSLDALGKRFSNFALRGSAETSGWSANIAADEVAGDVSYRAGKGARIVARLTHLAIPDDTPGLKPVPAGSSGPAELPAIDLAADEFIFHGKQLGRVELLARRDGADWRIENFSMVNTDASLSGRGVWSGAPSRTAIDFDVNAANAGAFLARVGQPGLVKGGKVHLQGSLAWRGNPGALDFPTLNGEVTLNAENGQFLEIEPGLGKLIGLMSLQALPKRITLDFRDVFSKGFQFDRITAAARVENGAIKLKEPLRMRGSAAEVEMTGEADVARETQNLRVRVVPSLADSASIGIAIVNPVAGVAAAIAQRLLKNPLGQIFAFDYEVSGTWTDPKVAKIHAPPLPQSEFAAQ